MESGEGATTSPVRTYWRVAPDTRSHRAGPPEVLSGGHWMPDGSRKNRGIAALAQDRDRKLPPEKRDLVARDAARSAHEHSGSIPLPRHVQYEDASLSLEQTPHARLP